MAHSFGLLTFRAQAQAPGKVPYPRTLTHRERSRDSTWIRSASTTASCALAVAPSPPLTPQVEARVSAKAQQPPAATRVTGSPDSTLTRTIRGTVSWGPRELVSGTRNASESGEGYF